MAAAPPGVKSISDILTEQGVSPEVLNEPPGMNAVQTDPNAELFETEVIVNIPKDGEPPAAAKPAETPEEVPAILKDEPPASEDGLPTEDEIKAALATEPDEKRRVEQEKGIRKLVNRYQAEIEKLKGQEGSDVKLRSWEQALANPETAEDALAQLNAQVRAMHSLNGQVQAQTETTTTGKTEDERVPGETWDQTKSRWFGEWSQQMEARLDAKYGAKLGSVEGFVNQAQAREQALSKAEVAFPAIKAQYGDFVTPEMVREAATNSKFSSLSVEDAFAATHVKAIARHFAEHGKKLAVAPKREMVTPISAQEIQRQPGQYVNFDQIFQEMHVE